MRLSDKASPLFLNNLRIKGEIRTLFSQAPLPVQTEKILYFLVAKFLSTRDPGKDPKRQREADCGKETGARDAEWCKALNTS